MERLKDLAMANSKGMECDLCRKTLPFNKFYGSRWFKGVLCIKCCETVMAIRQEWANECGQGGGFERVYRNGTLNG
jgi:hypothetical protein